MSVVAAMPGQRQLGLAQGLYNSPSAGQPGQMNASGIGAPMTGMPPSMTPQQPSMGQPPGMGPAPMGGPPPPGMPNPIPGAPMPGASIPSMSPQMPQQGNPQMMGQMLNPGMQMRQPMTQPGMVSNNMGRGSSLFGLSA